MAQGTGPQVADTPEVANYRYIRRVMWQTVRSRFAVALEEAMATGPEGEARKVAARAVRGDVRSFMSELLTHAPVPALVRFLAVAREWGESGELLLDHNDAVLGLIDTIHPQPTWNAPKRLDRGTAEDDAQWGPWVEIWLAKFRATGPEAAAAVGGSQAAPVPSPGGEGSTLRRWAPWLVTAAAVFGTTAIVAVVLRE